MKRSALPLIWGDRAGCGGGGRPGREDGLDGAAAVRKGVVGPHPLNGNPEGSEPRPGASQERSAGRPIRTGEELGEGEPGAVIDGDI